MPFGPLRVIHRAPLLLLPMLLLLLLPFVCLLLTADTVPRVFEDGRPADEDQGGAERQAQGWRYLLRHSQDLRRKRGLLSPASLPLALPAFLKPCVNLLMTFFFICTAASWG